MTGFFVQRRLALGICLSIALAGCGGGAAVPQLFGNGGVESVPLGRQDFTRGNSWMSSQWLNELRNPHHKKRKLLYLDAHGKGEHVVDILDYRTGSLFGQLYYGLYGASTLCSDRNGNIYAQSAEAGAFEIRAGTAKVIKRFDGGSGKQVSGCAVSKSGDVAFTIANKSPVSCSGSGVEVFPGGKRRGTFYPGPDSCGDNAAAYDDKGNLFISDGKLWELPAGGSSWMRLRSNRSISPGHLEWDGKYLALLEPYQLCLTQKKPGRSCIDQIGVSGNTYKVVNTIQFFDPSCRIAVIPSWGENAKNPNGQTTSPATEIVASACDQMRIHVWSYPAGGEPTRTIPLQYGTGPGAVTIAMI
jgi:hypothetical protein